MSNHVQEYLQDIKVINPIIKKNKQFGIQFFLKDIKNSKNKISIEIINSKNIKDEIKFAKTDGVRGKIIIDNKLMFNN